MINTSRFVYNYLLYGKKGRHNRVNLSHCDKANYYRLPSLVRNRFVKTYLTQRF